MTAAARVFAHKPIDGDDYMPLGWCGECETCRHYPAPVICEACTYHPMGVGVPVELPTPVYWPCVFATVEIADDEKKVCAEVARQMVIEAKTRALWKWDESAENSAKMSMNAIKAYVEASAR